MYAWTSCTHNRSLIHARLSEATKRLEACRLFFTEITTSVIDIEVDGNHKILPLLTYERLMQRLSTLTLKI